MHICLLWELCLSGRGLWVWSITRPEETYQVWCVWVWSRSLDNEYALAHWGLLRNGKGNNIIEANLFKKLYKKKLEKWDFYELY